MKRYDRFLLSLEICLLISLFQAQETLRFFFFFFLQRVRKTLADV